MARLFFAGTQPKNYEDTLPILLVRARFKPRRIVQPFLADSIIACHAGNPKSMTSMPGIPIEHTAY
jgi:hypothetical protein